MSVLYNYNNTQYQSSPIRILTGVFEVNLENSCEMITPMTVQVQVQIQIRVSP